VDAYRVQDITPYAKRGALWDTHRRHAKTLYSTKESAERPYLVSAEDEAAQASYVADHVLEYREAGIALKWQAVLFRAAHHSDLLEMELGRRNIPFVKHGGLKFLEAAHVKDVLAILRWAENPRDAVAGLRALQLHPGERSLPGRVRNGLSGGGRRIRTTGLSRAESSVSTRFCRPEGWKKPFEKVPRLRRDRRC
jgi:ATP-dependent DNA helicase UvrD/PcrA